MSRIARSARCFFFFYVRNSKYFANWQRFLIRTAAVIRTRRYSTLILRLAGVVPATCELFDIYTLTTKECD